MSRNRRVEAKDTACSPVPPLPGIHPAPSPGSAPSAQRRSGRWRDGLRVGDRLLKRGGGGTGKPGREAAACATSAVAHPGAVPLAAHPLASSSHLLAPVLPAALLLACARREAVACLNMSQIVTAQFIAVCSSGHWFRLMSDPHG